MKTTLAVAILVMAGPAHAQGPRTSEGARLAATWCANCHAIGPGARPPTGDAAPGFPAVAATPSTTEMSLRAFLATPHANMPDYQLSRDETDVLVSYILSLRR